MLLSIRGPMRAGTDHDANHVRAHDQGKMLLDQFEAV